MSRNRPSRRAVARRLPARRIGLLGATVVAALSISGCSSGYQSDYVSPIAAATMPHPRVPVAEGGARSGRMPLLPPVPGEKPGDD